MCSRIVFIAFNLWTYTSSVWRSSRNVSRALSMCFWSEIDCKSLTHYPWRKFRILFSYLTSRFLCHSKAQAHCLWSAITLIHVFCIWITSDAVFKLSRVFFQIRTYKNRLKLNLINWSYRNYFLAYNINWTITSMLFLILEYYNWLTN